MFTWKAFDMFVTRDKIAQADASNVAAGARLQQAQREVRSQLEQALVRERHAKQRVELLRDGSRIAREAVLLAKVRYETGNAILTEVLDAELEGTSIESRAVQAAYELAIAHVDRIQAEGRRL
jgi:outer membrane protein TolC